MRTGIQAGYTHKTGMVARKDVIFTPTPSKIAAEVSMIETFADIVASADTARSATFCEASLKTQ